MSEKAVPEKVAKSAAALLSTGQFNRIIDTHMLFPELSEKILTEANKKLSSEQRSSLFTSAGEKAKNLLKDMTKDPACVGKTLALRDAVGCINEYGRALVNLILSDMGRNTFPNVSRLSQSVVEYLKNGEFKEVEKILQQLQKTTELLIAHKYYEGSLTKLFAQIREQVTKILLKDTEVPLPDTMCHALGVLYASQLYEETRGGSLATSTVYDLNQMEGLKNLDKESLSKINNAFALALTRKLSSSKQLFIFKNLLSRTDWKQLEHVKKDSGREDPYKDVTGTDPTVISLSNSLGIDAGAFARDVNAFVARPDSLTIWSSWHRPPRIVIEGNPIVFPEINDAQSHMKVVFLMETILGTLRKHFPSASEDTLKNLTYAMLRRVIVETDLVSYLGKQAENSSFSFGEDHRVPTQVSLAIEKDQTGKSQLVMRRTGGCKCNNSLTNQEISAFTVTKSFQMSPEDIDEEMWKEEVTITPR